MLYKNGDTLICIKRLNIISPEANLGHGEVLIENFIKKHNFEGMGPLEETSFELQGLQGRLPTSKDII